MKDSKRRVLFKILIRSIIVIFLTVSMILLHGMKKSIAMENDRIYQELVRQKEDKQVPMEEPQLVQEESETGSQEGIVGRYCAAFPHLNIPVYVMKRNLLYSYIMYGINSYCEEQGIQDKFSCNIDEQLHWATYYNAYGETWDQNAYSIDLSREIIPELQNNIYNFYLTGETHNIYVQVNTYLMKIFVYDEADTVIFPGEDNEDIRKKQ